MGAAARRPSIRAGRAAAYGRAPGRHRRLEAGADDRGFRHAQYQCGKDFVAPQFRVPRGWFEDATAPQTASAIKAVRAGGCFGFWTVWGSTTENVGYSRSVSSSRWRSALSRPCFSRYARTEPCSAFMPSSIALIVSGRASLVKLGAVC